MARGATAALLGLAAAGCLLWLLLERRTTRSGLLADAPATIAVAPVETATVEPSADREPAPPPEASSEQPPQTARSFLADYWGSRWAEIEPKMRARTDIDVPFEFVPWEEARDTLASHIIPSGEGLEGQIQG